MKPHYLYLKTLLLLLLLAGTVVTASAYDFYKDGIYYNRTSSSTVEVTGDFEEESPCIAIDYTNYSGRVNIPRQVTYNGVTYTVDGIGDHAFKNSGISYLVIPATVEYIGYHAFEGCGFSSIECYSTEPGIMSTWGWGIDYSAGSADCLYVLPDVLSDFQDSYRWQGYCSNIMALDVVMINSTNFPDANFRNYLLSRYPDGYLTQYDIANATSLSVYSKGIANMKGIEFFTELKELRCWGNSFTSLDLYFNTKLTYLDCAPNSNLTSLYLSRCSELQTLICYSTGLTSLSVCGKPYLTMINCNNCTSLKFIYCYNDNLTTLNVTGCTALERLECYYNYNLEEITGLGDCTAITYLDCEDCAISNLDPVDLMTNLEMLYCRNNKISTLTLNNKPNLSFVRISGNPNLTTLRCSGNSQLSSVYIYDCPALESAWINMNNLSSLDLSGCTSLKNLSIWQNHISGNAMTNLVNSLPTVPGNIPGEFAVLDNVNEGNVITDAQVLTAKRKNWVCQRWTGNNWAIIDVPMPGDVDGNGVVNIADVTTLIDILLSGGTAPANADVDGSGNVNIADVTALIDMLLSGNA